MTIQDCIIFIDFEGSKATGVVEYGWVAVQSGEIIRAETACCKPQKLVSAKDIGVHGLTNDQLDSFESFSCYWEVFADLREKNVFAAHNASVENNFLKWVWPNPRPSVHGIEDELTQTWSPWIDTLNLYKKYYPQLDSYKLQDLITIFHLQDELDQVAEKFCPENRQKFHCALYDTLASVVLFQQIRQAVYQNQDSNRLYLLDSLAASQYNDRTQTQFEFDC